MIVIALAGIVGVAFALQETERLEVVAQGEVVAISTDDNKLTLAEAPDPAVEALAPGAMQTGVRRDFVVNDATELTVSGAAMSLDDITTGAWATVTYVMDFGRNVALAIEVSSPSTD
jgi:hypothetical protein